VDQELTGSDVQLERLIVDLSLWAMPNQPHQSFVRLVRYYMVRLVGRKWGEV